MIGDKDAFSYGEKKKRHEKHQGLLILERKKLEKRTLL